MKFLRNCVFFDGVRYKIEGFRIFPTFWPRSDILHTTDVLPTTSPTGNTLDTNYGRVMPHLKGLLIGTLNKM